MAKQDGGLRGRVEPHLYPAAFDVRSRARDRLRRLDRRDRRGVGRLVCLGDLVGYNADSDEVVRVLRARNALCIAGNHDLSSSSRKNRC